MYKISSHQPSFFPWIGYWHKVAASHQHVMSGGVKFNYANYQNRVPLLDFILVLPVKKECHDGPVKDVRIVPGSEVRMFKTVEQALTGKKWKHRDKVQEILDTVRREAKASPFLIDYNIAIYAAMSKALGVDTPTVLDLTVPNDKLTKTERLEARVGQYAEDWGWQYLAGSGANYIETSQLTKCTVLFQTVSKEAPSVSALQLIAEVDDPLRGTENLFGWS